MILHECYKDIEKVKELVNRNGYIRSLGGKPSNTRFGGREDEVETVVESLDDYKEGDEDFPWEYRYLFDSAAGGWMVFYMGKEAGLTDIANNVAIFRQWEPGGGPESFSKVQEFRKLLNNGYQCWPAGDMYLDSYFVTDDGSVVVYDGFHNKKLFAIPCASLAEANEISERIFGKTLVDIQKDFQPGIVDVLANAVLRAGKAMREEGTEIEFC